MAEVKKKTDEEKLLSFLKTAGLFFINIVVLLYYTFLFKIVWNWFIADYLFTLTYLEMLVGTIALRYILNGKGSLLLANRYNKRFGEPSTGEVLGNAFVLVVFRTLGFGFLYILHLMVSYYS